ncbi:Cytochrome c oxidase subunit 2 [Burkholderiales bacterium 8X]|nr:Cytochrome c oxidase subunit 2 [Burkholderiales bacterium 8X]
MDSVLAPAGIQAARIFELWNLTLAICTAVFAAVLFAVLLALIKASRRAREEKDEGPREDDPGLRLESPGSERRPRRAVIAGTAVSVFLLCVLLVTDFATDHALSRLPTAGALQIEVVGHQWWWEGRYRSAAGADGASDATGGGDFSVANEFTVPVGRTVSVSLKSVDVIHSLWVPALFGKKDMIPGRSTEMVFRADRPGIYRGQCAEFCGTEHAFMAFSIEAVAPETYARWEEAQRASASPPAASTAAERGWQLFGTMGCAQCHTVRGTAAAGGLGPDLTHLASRRTLAAGTLPNQREALARWISDPQQLKPGTTMPATRLPPDQLQDLASYLESLR